jgi:hypothetical protein
MGKVTIEFDTVEEAEDIQNALNGYKWKLAMWDLDQMLRGYVKYDGTLSEDKYDAYVKVRELIRETLADYGLNIND